MKIQLQSYTERKIEWNYENKPNLFAQRKKGCNIMSNSVYMYPEENWDHYYWKMNFLLWFCSSREIKMIQTRCNFPCSIQNIQFPFCNFLIGIVKSVTFENFLFFRLLNARMRVFHWVHFFLQIEIRNGNFNSTCLQ